MKNRINYFITKSSFFGIGYFLLIKYSNNDSWISLLLGTFIGLIILLLYKNIYSKINNNIIQKIIYITIYLYLLTIILTVLPMFTNSFYLYYTPKLIINIPFILIALYLSFKNNKIILKLSNILFTISIFSIILSSLLLLNKIDFNNIYPILNTKYSNILLSSILYASISAIPNIILYDQNNKNIIENYIISSISLLLILLLIIMCLGNLSSIYSFPEYIVYKKVNLLDFIQNIENIVAINWYIDLFITVSFILKKLNKLINNNIIFIIVIFFITIISSLLIGDNYTIIINMFYKYPFILLISLFIIIFIQIINKKKESLDS